MHCAYIKYVVRTYRAGVRTIDSFNGSLSALEYHVLLALVEGPLYGYAITGAVEEESGGTVAPRAGTLYRVIARLMSWGFVSEEDEPCDAEETHPGRPRRWYGLTTEGRALLTEESRRLAEVAALAAKKLELKRS